MLVLNDLVTKKRLKVSISVSADVQRENIQFFVRHLSPILVVCKKTSQKQVGNENKF